MEHLQIKPTKTGFDILLERLVFIILILLWIYVIISYQSLPEMVPMHYDISGKIDRYDNKIMTFLLPAILTLIVTGLFFLTRFSYKLNSPVPITKENAEVQYRIAGRMLRVINLVIVIAFSYITIKSIYDSTHPQSFLDWWFIPALFISLCGTTAYFIWKSFKAR